MKKITLLLLLVCSTLTAQLSIGDISLDFGEPVTTKDGEVIQIAGEQGETIYTLARKKKKFFLQTFDAKTKAFKSSSLLKFDKINGGRPVIEDLAIIENKVFLMLSYFDKKAKTYNFLAKEIKGTKIIKSTVVLSVPVQNKKKRGSFVFVSSYDEHNYLVSHVGINYKKEELSYTVELLDE